MAQKIFAEYMLERKEEAVLKNMPDDCFSLSYRDSKNGEWSEYATIKRSDEGGKGASWTLRTDIPDNVLISLQFSLEDVAKHVFAHIAGLDLVMREANCDALVLQMEKV